MDVDAVLAELFALVSPHLTERQRRLLLGAGARALGLAAGRRMTRISGMSRPMVYAGRRELEEPPTRRAGSGVPGWPQTAPRHRPGPGRGAGRLGRPRHPWGIRSRRCAGRVYRLG